ncbi:GntR family transcriptional regulator [Cryptosporangium sp. NPDC048952]|uniref:GntR family transcriptional regulator n=1 Tax=Cryptosporangium sp. NPDC048952 TaxID=3363961 RepID=UPI003719DA4C
MTAIGAAVSLPQQLADALRARIRAKEWAPGEKLPTEAELVAAYELSRATVRQAIKDLESQGLVVVRHGRGTFMSPHGGIHAGMQELTSISSSIAEMGLTPSMKYRRRTIRSANDDELVEFDLERGAKVLDIQRKILADGVVVAYSYDILPRWAFPETFKASQLRGSVFGYLAEHNGPRPTRAVAEVHAVRSDIIGWDDDEGEDKLYVLLDQLQYDDHGRPFMHSRSFFLEGKFNFTVIRTH